LFFMPCGMSLHAAISGMGLSGRQGAMGRGIAHPKGERRRVIFGTKIMGRPLAPRQGAALSGVWLPLFERVSAFGYQGRRCGQEQAR